jgi:hypothetical protein
MIGFPPYSRQRINSVVQLLAPSVYRSSYPCSICRRAEPGVSVRVRGTVPPGGRNEVLKAPTQQYDDASIPSKHYL